jgi:hypothetical protein
MKARAPVLGGNFGVWGGLFSTFDCAVKGVRKKEDPWNAIIAGFFTVSCCRLTLVFADDILHICTENSGQQLMDGNREVLSQYEVVTRP